MSSLSFLFEPVQVQRKLNKQGLDLGQSVKIVHRHLRMEGFDDVYEQRQLNDKNGDWGGYVTSLSTEATAYF
ncbi:hypothetical protein BLNAU_7861 [Blattamonas nauphoetae]|uniref:Uncharacterized protein n=1 Tax=Blattamonas nauphoetae TaxID=2049346 RepID=A0ABQ9Y0K2_9EUKA|nr:hypothetical protein BLNAU_7861 [Blattamonas nauphoetae]